MGPALSYRPREHIVHANSICIGMKLNYTSVKLQSKKHLNGPLFSAPLNALRQEIRHIRMTLVLLRSKIPHWKIDILLKQEPFL